MAQRQLYQRTLKQVWSYLHFPNRMSQSSVYNSRPMPLVTPDVSKASCPPSVFQKIVFRNDSSSNIPAHYAEKNKTFIDLFTNNPYKKLYMPTISVNKLKVYEDLTLLKVIEDPVLNKIKIIDAPVPGKPEKKEAVRMILIRRRKMRKHKLRKLRKRMKFVFAKIKLKRELRKEQAFRTELLSQVEKADNFDVKVYVENILNTIRYQPLPETEAERIERYRLRKKMNRYQTNFIRPNFDD